MNLGGDLNVNRIGFGAMRITGKGVWGPPEDPAEARRVLRRVVELGIDFVDTAESYGPHVSEQLIGETLHPYPRGFVVATKGGFDRPGPSKWVENARPERLREELDGSLQRLKLDRIDLYQLHRIDPNVPEKEQFDALAEFQREGKVRHIGLSEVSVAEIKRAAKHFTVVSVQNRYNVADREWEKVVDYCEDNGIAFIPWYPLNVGKLAGKRGALARIAKKHHATPAQIALAWLLKRSPVILPIPGTGSVAHLEENTVAATIELSDEDFGVIGET
jgi:pyridoxine 4-dehydrogenase